VNPPVGVRGGLPGGAADQHIMRADGERERLPACAQIRVRDGERIIAVSAGGGGYGSPLERAATRVAHDVRAGLVSVERAREVYGVNLEPDGAVDEPRTQRERTMRQGLGKC
jgi:N-methylhydantoinase B